MQKILATALAALAILAFTWEVPTNAQADAPDGDALVAKANAVRAAVVSGTPDDLLKSLAPWMQGRAKLFRGTLHKMIDDDIAEAPEEHREAWAEEAERELVRDINERDPNGTLGVETMADFKALTGAQILAIETGQLMLHADADLVARADTEWFEVDRVIYTASEKVSWRSDDREIERTYGDIAFMTSAGDTLTVSCVADSGRWQVVDFGISIGEWDLVLNKASALKNPVKKVVDKSARDARRSEGEIVLGSFKAAARVTYAKTGAAPKTLSGDCGVEESDLKSYYFILRDTIYKKPDAERGALVVEPQEPDIGWGVMYFNYKDPNSNVKWYDTEEDLEQALKAFQTAK